MMTRTINPPPANYTSPPFPSLYSPFDSGTYLYYSHDVWRFTLFWTLIVFEVFHLAASGYAFAIQWKEWKYMWIVPVVYLVIGGIEALLAGSVVGLILGAVYDAGDFRMSTWIPFIWAFIDVLVIILSSFAIQSGL